MQKIVTAVLAADNLLAADLEHVLTHTRPLWESLRGQRIFVTGGTGFFGRWLLETFAHVNRLLSLDVRMVVLSRDPEAFARKAPHLVRDSAFAFVRGDVRNLNATDVSDKSFGFMIHAATAASAKLNAEDPQQMRETIVDGTRAALEFAVAKGVRRFLLTSSGAVYGPQPSTMTHVPENFFPSAECEKAETVYGEGKRQAEALCARFHGEYEIDPLIARCFAFVGPLLPLDAHFAIGNFIRDALAGGPIRVSGDGTPFRSYLYASDLMIWLWTILFRGAALRPYNVGSSHDLSIAQLAGKVSEVLGGEVVIAKEPNPESLPMRYVPSNMRAISELQLQERVDLPEAIRRTASFACLS